MKKFLILSIVLLSALGYQSETLAFGKICTVDVQVIETQGKIFKNLLTQIEKAKQKLDGKYKPELAKFAKQKEELETKKGLLSKTELAKKATELNQRYQQLQLQFNKDSQKLSKNSTNAINIIIKPKFDRVLKSVSKEQGCATTMNHAAVLYAKNQSDITSDVIIELDSKISKYNFDLF